METHGEFRGSEARASSLFVSTIRKLVPVLLLLAGCSRVPILPGLTPYRMDIQQGNYVTQDMVAKLKPGMSRAQVRFALGTPLVVDPFHSDRWDYVYVMQKRGQTIEHRRLIVLFQDDKLLRLDGDVKPAETNASVQQQPANMSPSLQQQPAETSAGLRPPPGTTGASPQPAPDARSTGVDPLPGATSADVGPVPDATAPSIEPPPAVTTPLAEPAPVNPAGLDPASGATSAGTEPVSGAAATAP